MNQINVNVIKTFMDVPDVESVVLDQKIQITATLKINLPMCEVDNQILKKKRELLEKYPNLILEIKYDWGEEK